MRWLMTEPYIDPCNCEMLLETDELFSGKPLLITVVTKDQYGRISFNDKVTVELWITNAENCMQDVSVLSNMDKSKMRSIVYQPTYLNRARYVAITMMKSAQGYSFEELRLAHQSCSIAKEVLSVRCQQDGFYLAAWIPKRSGNYRIECRVDTFLIDQTQTIDIKNGLVTKKPANTNLCQTLKFSTATCNATDTRGIRIRIQPDLASNSIGNVPVGATLFFTQELENKDGVWLKLSEESTTLFCPGFSKRNAVWCLQYHKHLKKVLLIKEMETNSDRNDTSNSATMQSIVMVCEENYRIVAHEMQAGVPIRATPSKFARIFGFINAADVISSVGWVQNPEGIWIQLDRTVLAKFVQHASMGTLTGDGYCLVQENVASTAYFERIISPSTSVSAFNQRLQEESDDARQASTQTSPSSEEKVKLHITKARIRHEYQSRMKPTVKVPPQNTVSRNHIPYAMETTIADCIRSVFAAILWNEQLIYDAMACAAFLKFHPELQRLQFRNELTVTSNMFSELTEFNIPISLQILLALFKEISSAVLNVIEKHLILPSPPMALKTSAIDRKCSLTNTQVYFCELCERWFPSLITAHMSIAHPGCGRHAGGQGYNSLGKLTTGWTGNCGDGGTSYLTWYLLCQKCREYYLIKTESQRQKVKKLRARSFRISTGNTEPQTILKNNAVFLLQLNYANHASNDKEVLNDLVGSKETRTKHSEENLDYLFTIPSSFNPSLQGSSNSSQITRKISKPFDPIAALMPNHSVAPYASDPGPKRSRTDDDVSLPSSEPSVHPVEAIKRSRIGSIFNATESQLLLASPSNALKVIAQNKANPSSIHTTCQRPVMAFLIQHHNLQHLRDAMHLATSRAALFEKAFHTLNWLLRNTTNPLSVIDILWHFVNALHQQEMPQLIHPMKLTFLSGHFRSHMMAKFHTILNTVASVLKNYEHISLETLRCCLHSWMFNFLPEDQDLILKSQIIDTLSRIVSESNNDGSRTVDATDQNKSIIEIHKMEDLTAIMTIETISHPAMVPYLLDKNTDTFWESGDEEKGQTKIIKVRSNRSGSKFAHISIFVDNVKDDAHKVEHVCFAEQYEKEYRKIKSRLIDSDFRGWIKCSINQNCSLIIIELKSSDHHVRLRQLQVLGRNPQLPETSVATFKHSPSIFMHFDTITSDAFELFRLIASFAFGNESTKDEELQQQVLNILFSKSQLNSLQSYVSTQIVVALEREISLLKDKIKRNYSYSLGLISMLLQISNVKFQKFVNNQTLLASLTELVLFSPENIQRPTLELLEYIFGFFDVKMINDVNHVIDNLLLSMIKAGSFQLRSIPIDITRQINVRESMINDPSLAWHLNRTTSLKIAQEIRKLLSSLCSASSQYGSEWSNAIKRRVAECLTDSVIVNSSYKDSPLIVKSKVFWMAMASLAVIRSEDWLNCSPVWRQTVADIRATIAYCENHDDGSTVASVACGQCGDVNLCGDCSTTIHLPRAKRGHVLRQLASAGASLQIVVHETGCRLKTNRMAILVDYTSLNGLIDFRKDIQSNMNSSSLLLGVPKCRFCGFNNATGMHDTCYEQECQEKLAMACKKVLPCGHLCGGIIDEKICLPCLKCHNSPHLRQDAEDICVICFTDTLSSAPSIQLSSCSHVFHYKCCSTVLLKRWHSARITFSFMDCPVCKLEMAHESLDHLLKPLQELKDDVGKKAALRLTYDGMSSVKEEEKLEYAMKRYAYYQCYKCGRAYFGGEAQCQVNNDVNYDPSELLCGACSDVSQAQICPQHGTDFLEYKCRYCCSIAVFFCFGTTHFCSQCHDEFQRLISMPKNQMPQCPVGPKFTMLTP
uniref:RCR-type E3 ubiquitin transferase n=1 Tax=Romanomermis culicivorax TaxID=13658 RepID=A0A915IBF2_ROMCU